MVEDGAVVLLADRECEECHCRDRRIQCVRLKCPPADCLYPISGKCCPACEGKGYDLYNTILLSNIVGGFRRGEGVTYFCFFATYHMSNKTRSQPQVFVQFGVE